MSKKREDNSQFNYRPRPNNPNNVLGISFSHNPEQKELIRLMNEEGRPVIFCTGDAGTGKTFTALVAALGLVFDKKYRKIFYIREPLEVGKSLGFLPGDIGEKYGVYLDGLNDNLEHICDNNKSLNVNNLKTLIECIPPQFVRGRSFENAILLVDEAQNLSLDTIHTLMTRIGKFCKIVFMGSMNQIDIRGKTADNNDFMTAYEIVKDLDNIVGYVRLIKSERSEYCKILDEAFTNYKYAKRG
jgi:predicted ribonuclease YlaK